MARYRKVPVEVDAWSVRELVDAAAREWTSLPALIATAYDAGDVLFIGYDADEAMKVRTPYGFAATGIDDWLVRDQAGDLWPYTADAFGAAHDLAALSGTEPNADMPFATRNEQLAFIDASLASGVVIAAAIAPGPDGPLPCLIYSFAKVDSSGFHPPIALVLDDERLGNVLVLTAAAVDTVEATLKRHGS